MANRDVYPPLPVEILRHDIWIPGQLEAWQKAEGGWRAFIRWSAGVGLTHIQWFWADEVREVHE